MRGLRSFLLIVAFCSSEATIAAAQAPVQRSLAEAPVILSLTVSEGKPVLTARGLLFQAGAGALGGLAGMAMVGIPLMLASMDAPVGEGVMVTLLGGAYVAGTTVGIHYAGGRQGMRGNPWATVAGTLGGLAISGALMQPFIDDEGNADGPAPLLVFILPGIGGTSGYAVTRRSR